MYLDKFKLIFWDFDGVIKDSVKVKTNAYLNLFPNIQDDIKKKIKNHHLKFGGISRSKKIPIYLLWAGITVDEKNLLNYTKIFEQNIIQSVISSSWIEGVISALQRKQNRQKFVLVTGTPQSEIEVILSELNIGFYFDFVFGFPAEKDLAIQSIISQFKYNLDDCLLIGDSESDWLASRSTGINFLLRTDGNDIFSESFKGKKIKNFFEIF